MFMDKMKTIFVKKQRVLLCGLKDSMFNLKFQFNFKNSNGIFYQIGQAISKMYMLEPRTAREEDESIFPMDDKAL